MIVYNKERKTIFLPNSNQPIMLRNKEIELWHFLIEQSPAVSSRESLSSHIWGGRYVTDYAINQTINSLRRKIGDTTREIIITVPRKGYTVNIGKITVVIDDETEFILHNNHEATSSDKCPDNNVEHASINKASSGEKMESKSTLVEKKTTDRRELKISLLMIAALTLSYAGGGWFSAEINAEKKEETLYLDGNRIHSTGERIEYFQGERKTVCYRAKKLNDEHEKESLMETTICKYDS